MPHDGILPPPTMYAAFFAFPASTSQPRPCVRVFFVVLDIPVLAAALQTSLDTPAGPRSSDSPRPDDPQDVQHGKSDGDDPQDRTPERTELKPHTQARVEHDEGG